MPEKHISICKCCLACCPIEVTVEDGRVTNIAADRQSPWYGGYTCPKGRAQHNAHYSPDRILHPQKRMPDGSYQSIPMQQAIDEISERLQKIIEEHGPRAIGMFPGSGALNNPVNLSLAANFIMEMGTFPDRFFSVAAIDQPGKMIAQALHGRWLGGPNRFAESDAWIFVGVNPIISKQCLMVHPGRELKDATGNGMKLIVVDPRVSETAKHAFLHIRPKPGHDVRILAGILNIILSEELYDHEFVAAETQGIDALKQAVARYTPQAVAEMADVPVEQLLLAARTFAAARKGGVGTGTGAHFALHGSLLEYLALSLKPSRRRSTHRQP